MNIGERCTLSVLTKSKGLNKDAIVIEHNGEIVSKDKWFETYINNDDTIEIVNYVGGG